MEMHQIRYFLAACETLNFTKAAEISFVSQPALTKAIRMLEEELGGPLFDRQARPLKLTDFGRSLQMHFSSIWDLTLEIRQIAKQYGALEKAAFQIGVLNSIGDRVMLRMMTRLQRQLPGIEISIRHVAQAHLMQNLRDGLLELALLADTPLIDSRYETHVLYEEPYRVAFHADHRLGKKDEVALKDLSGEPYIRRSHCERNSHINELMAKLGIEVTTHLESDQDEFVRRMIASGLGLSILPLSVVQETVKSRPLTEPPITRKILLASSATRQLSKLAETVREHIRSEDWTRTP